MYHTNLAHLIWKDFLKPGMTVIDATAGNGFDAVFLASHALTERSGWLHAFDIQEEAILSTRRKLEETLSPALQKRVTLHHASHEFFPPNLAPSLIVYNLGYLPHGDKEKTTMSQSTLNSCKMALEILAPKGLLSITTYPGHSEGVKEKNLLFSWLSSLSTYPVFHHTPLNRPNQPSFITLRKH